MVSSSGRGRSSLAAPFFFVEIMGALAAFLVSSSAHALAQQGSFAFAQISLTAPACLCFTFNELVGRSSDGRHHCQEWVAFGRHLVECPSHSPGSNRAKPRSKLTSPFAGLCRSLPQHLPSFAFDRHDKEKTIKRSFCHWHWTNH